MAEPPTPLKRQYVLEVLDSVDQRAVLVGGQAVAWWAEYYGAQGRMAALAESTAMYVSKDADFAARSLHPRELRPMVKELAARLHGLSHFKFPFTSVVVASVTFTDDDGEERTVEFLREVYGVGKRRRVLDEAVGFEAAGDLPSFYVMHPVMLLESRVANVVDLDGYQTETAILQARIAVEVLREWHLDQLEDGWAGAKKGIERTLKLAEHARGIAIAAAHDVEVFTAIPGEHEALPPQFREKRLEPCREMVAAAIAAARAS
ncbi:MAG: hypothetical protein H6719_00320 [Sandaracinaceae bacterium]|nr:hypothetical protein [Sandaracinaceae bacterium]